MKKNNIDFLVAKKTELDNLLLLIGFIKKSSTSWDECFYLTVDKQYELIIETYTARYAQQVRLMELNDNCWECYFQVGGSILAMDFNWDKLISYLNIMFSVQIRKNKIRKILNDN